MKKIEEQLESIEEVLMQLVRKISGIEETAQKIKTDDRTRNMLTDLKSDVNKMSSSQQLQAQMSEIKTSVENLPKQSQVKHHHHFDIQSKGFIISAAILMIVSAISVGIAVTNNRENNGLHEVNVKYRMIRQVNPQISAWADSMYYKDPKVAEQETQKREALELVVKDAEVLLKQKQQETENAQNFLKRLKKE